MRPLIYPPWVNASKASTAHKIRHFVFNDCFPACGIELFPGCENYRRASIAVMPIDLNISGDRLSTISGAEVTACPRCDARLLFTRSCHLRIDSCGFESYRLECRECGAQLAGIIDPADDALLLCEPAA